MEPSLKEPGISDPSSRAPATAGGRLNDSALDGDYTPDKDACDRENVTATVHEWRARRSESREAQGFKLCLDDTLCAVAGAAQFGHSGRIGLNLGCCTPKIAHASLSLWTTCRVGRVSSPSS